MEENVLKRKTIVVTGGCGYIGSHVARAFKDSYPDCRIVVIDRVHRDHTLVGVDLFHIDDFASPGSLRTIAGLQPDLVVHCAGTSLVGPSMTDPSDYYDNNVAKTIKLLNVLKDMKTKPVVMFSSSASVYGNIDHVATENDLVNPISPYGNSKAMIERVLADYNAAYGIPSYTFRYFNAAGAMPFTFDLGQEPNATHIVARVLESKLNNQVFTLYGNDFDTEDGTCVRDYIHVWDIARAHVAAFKHAGIRDIVGGPKRARVMNLGTKQGHSNGEIVKYVIDTYGDFAVQYGERRAGDPDTLVADNALALQMLDWEPKFSDLATIIDTAYKWYQSRKQF